MRRDSVLAAVVSMLAMLLLIGTGCGIVTAPVSIPVSIAANHDAHLEGTITDAAGNALGEVTLTVQKTHMYWDAVVGERNVYEDSTSLVSGNFKVSRRASSLVRLIFTKRGYVPALVEFDDHSLYTAAASTTEPNAPDAGKVPDTQPGDGHYGSGVSFTGPVMPFNPNPMSVDPSWHPHQPVLIILYPIETK